MTRRDTIGGGAIAVGFDAQLRDARLLVELGVLKTGDRFRDALHLDAELAQLVEVRPENFDGHRCADATKHVANSVGEWTTDDRENAGDRLDALCKIIE